jgi:PAS domain S-box-containing protein
LTLRMHPFLALTVMGKSLLLNLNDTTLAIKTTCGFDLFTVVFVIFCRDVNEWNDKTAEITGYTKEEAFDCSLVETFIVPSMRDGVQDVLDNALEGRGTSNYELEFRTKSNEIRHLLVNATTRRDAENNVVGVVGVAQDVTEAVQRDRAVAGMALELRQLIDTANAPIFGIDIDGNVNEWNRRTSKITGYTKEEAFDEPLVETFIAESMQDKVQEILDSALAGNETSNYELEFVSKLGEPIFLLVNATTRRDPENVVVGGKPFFSSSI